MWLAFAIGAFLSLLGIIGLYVNEYWDEFNRKGKHRGTFQFQYYNANADTDRFVRATVLSQKGM